MPIRLLALILFSAVMGCQKGNDDHFRPTIDSFSIFETHNLEVSEKGVFGKGRMEFSTPLLGVNSKEHYLIRFRFLDQEKSKIVLHSHFSGFLYEDGMRIELLPKDGKLLTRVSSPGFPATETFELFPLSSAGGEITVRIEVHDGTSSGSRIIIWNDWRSFRGELIRPIDQIHVGNHAFDSHEEKLTFFSHGRGPFWGLELEQAQILISQRHFAYVE